MKIDLNTSVPLITSDGRIVAYLIGDPEWGVTLSRKLLPRFFIDLEKGFDAINLAWKSIPLDIVLDPFTKDPFQLTILKVQFSLPHTPFYMRLT